MPKESEAVETRVHEEQECNYILCTPKPVGAVICGRRGDSSVVKYKITATPGYDTCTHLKFNMHGDTNVHWNK